MFWLVGQSCSLITSAQSLENFTGIQGLPHKLSSMHEDVTVQVVVDVFSLVWFIVFVYMCVCFSPDTIDTVSVSSSARVNQLAVCRIKHQKASPLTCCHQHRPEINNKYMIQHSSPMQNSTFNNQLIGLVSPQRHSLRILWQWRQSLFSPHLIPQFATM